MQNCTQNPSKKNRLNFNRFFSLPQVIFDKISTQKSECENNYSSSDKNRSIFNSQLSTLHSSLSTHHSQLFTLILVLALNSIGWGQTFADFTSASGATGSTAGTSVNSTTTTPGYKQYTWTVPANVSSIMVEVWGGGGGANSRQSSTSGGAAGGGGAYSRKYSFVVTGGTTVLAIQVGRGGASRSTGTGTAGAGGVSYVKVTNHTGTIIASANGGGGGVNQASPVGGAGATTYSINSTAPITNDDYWYGGNGGNGGGNPAGGAGGGGAGSGNNGTSGGNTNGTPGSGGSAQTVLFSGLSGGNGGTYSGGAGNVRGGGASAATGNSTATPGNGGDGFVRITYTVCANTAPTSISVNSGTEPTCQPGSATAVDYNSNGAGTEDWAITVNSTTAGSWASPSISSTGAVTFPSGWAGQVTIRARRTGCSTTAYFDRVVTVNPTPSLSYSGSPFTFTQNTAISNLTPTTTATSYSASLPAGLSIGASDGVISGTPTTPQIAASYTITGTASGCSGTASISIAVRPSNDACSGATNLPCASGTISGTTVGAISETAPNASTSGTMGVWYSFTGDGGSTTLTVVQTTLDTRLLVMTSSTNSCGGTYTTIANQDLITSSSETATFTTTNGTNYYVYIGYYTSGSTTGTFTISRTCVAPPTITSFSPTSGCPGGTITINGTSLSGTSSVSVGGTVCSNITVVSSTQVTAVLGSGTTGTISLTATAGNTTSSGTFTVETPPTISYTGSPFTYTAGTSISSLTASTTGTPTSFSVSPSLPAGLTLNTSTGEITGIPTTSQVAASYTITASRANGCSGTASISIAVRPSNDACSGATNLPCATSNLAGTTVGSADETPPASVATSAKGVWYSFIGDGQSTTISSTAASGFDHEQTILTGTSCGDFTIVGASQDGSGQGGTETQTFIATNGQQYYVWVAYFTTGSTTGAFTISRTCTAIVANDACANAINLTVGASAISGSFVGDSPSGGSYDDSSYPDVWYKFTPACNGSYQVALTNSSFDADIYLYSDCSSTTNLLSGGATSASNETGTASLSAATTYYIRVVDFAQASSTFSIAVSLTSSTNSTPSAIIGSSNVCASASNLTYSVTNVSGNTYNWTLPSGWSQSAGGTTNSITLTAGSAGGILSVTATNSCGTSSASTISITVSANPAAPTITPTSASICSGAIQSLSASSGSGTSQGSVGLNAPIGTSSINFGISSFYNIFDVLQSATLVSVDVFPTDPIGTSASIVIANSSGTVLNTTNYTTFVTGGARQTVTINYSMTTGTGYRIGQGGSGISLIRDLAAGGYPYTSSLANITGSNNGTAYYYAYNMLFSASNQASITWSSTTNLFTDAAATVAYTGSAATQVYSKPSSTITYTATATNTSGCTSSTNVQVTVNALPTISGSSAASHCGAGTLGISATASAGTIEWFDAATSGTSLGTSNSASTWTTPSISTTTTYYAEAVNSSCRSASRTAVTAAVNASPSSPTSVTPNATTICHGNSVNLNATSAGNTINWYTVATDGTAIQTGVSAGVNHSVSPTSNTTYYAEAQSAAGCKSSRTATGLITVENPVSAINTAIGTTLANNDYVWVGQTDATWSTTNNWRQYNGTNLITPGFAPGSNNTNKIYVVQNSTSSNCIFNASSISLSGALGVADLFIGTGTSLNANGNNITLTGNFTNNGTFTPGSGTLTLSGGSNQTISGSGSTLSFSNVTINKSAGTLTASKDISISGAITFTSGILDMNNKNLTVEGSIFGGSITSYVMAFTNGTNTSKLIRKITSTSNAQYIFPIGSSTVYSPVTLTLTGGTLDNATVTVWTKNSKVSGLNSSIDKFLNRSWFVEPIGISSPLYNIEYKYGANEFNGTNLDELVPVKLSSNVWYAPVNSLLTNSTLIGNCSHNSDNKTLTWTGLTSFSEFGGSGNSSQPLPIELLSFNAYCNDQGIADLSWQTASEHNSSHFDVEKSRNGLDWEVIQTIPAAGNSNELITYQTVDIVNSEIQYYRLNQVDIDGTNKYYDPIAVDCDNSDKEVIQTYPNPSNEGFSVLVNNPKNKGDGKLTIVDATGALVSQKSISIQDGVNIFFIKENLTRGIYFIQIENEQHKTKTIKHVVN